MIRTILIAVAAIAALVGTLYGTYRALKSLVLWFVGKKIEQAGKEWDKIQQELGKAAIAQQAELLGNMSEEDKMEYRKLSGFLRNTGVTVPNV